MNNFKNAMYERSNGELIEIIAHLGSDYEPDALDVAKSEFKNRELNNVDFLSAMEELNVKITQQKEIAEMPLKWYWIVLFLFFPFVAVLPWLFFLGDHKTRKRNDTLKWAIIGFTIYWCLSMVRY